MVAIDNTAKVVEQGVRDLSAFAQPVTLDGATYILMREDTFSQIVENLEVVAADLYSDITDRNAGQPLTVVPDGGSDGIEAGGNNG